MALAICFSALSLYCVFANTDSNKQAHLRIVMDCEISRTYTTKAAIALSAALLLEPQNDGGKEAGSRDLSVRRERLSKSRRGAIWCHCDNCGRFKTNALNTASVRFNSRSLQLNYLARIRR